MTPRGFSLSTRERAMLVDLFDQLAARLSEQLSQEPGLFSNRIDEMSDLLLLSQTYADLIRSGDIRVYLRQWHAHVHRRLEELASDAEQGC